MCEVVVYLDLFWLDIKEVQLGLNPRKNAEVGCSCELDCVLVEEIMHTHTYRESNPMVKTIKTNSGFSFHLLG